jgi:hypothetical protein
MLSEPHLDHNPGHSLMPLKLFMYVDGYSRAVNSWVACSTMQPLVAQSLREANIYFFAWRHLYINFMEDKRTKKGRHSW